MKIHEVLLLQIQETEQCYSVKSVLLNLSYINGVAGMPSMWTRWCCTVFFHLQKETGKVFISENDEYFKIFGLSFYIYTAVYHFSRCPIFLLFFLFYFYYIFINQSTRLTFRSHTLYHLTQRLMKV